MKLTKRSPKIINDFPPVWEKIKESDLAPDIDNIAITYGDSIYVPSGRLIPDYLYEHEKVHIVAQGEMGADAWWDRYLSDKHFRLLQELEGYTRQYEFMCQKVKDRNARNRILVDIAQSLSGPAYGYITSSNYATNTIKRKANI